MQRYLNRSGNSNIAGYEIGTDRIIVHFIHGGVYSYTNASAGHSNVEQMKCLASEGRGLNTFINQNVHMLYAEKIR